MTVRKMEAASGLANWVRNLCSRARPTMPAGIVAMPSSHARRSSGVSILRRTRLRKKPRMMRTQSLRKKMNRATAG